MNENYPAPVSPLLYGIAREAYAAYFAALGEALGVSAARIEAARPALERVVGVHGGRLYYDLSAIHAALAQAPFGARLARYFDGFVGARGAPVAGGRRRRWVRSRRWPPRRRGRSGVGAGARWVRARCMRVRGAVVGGGAGSGRRCGSWWDGIGVSHDPAAAVDAGGAGGRGDVDRAWLAG
ncbi:MAG: hypothetical protein R3F65_20240 [bacterium]